MRKTIIHSYSVSFISVPLFFPQFPPLQGFTVVSCHTRHAPHTHSKHQHILLPLLLRLLFGLAWLAFRAHHAHIYICISHSFFHIYHVNTYRNMYIFSHADRATPNPPTLSRHSQHKPNALRMLCLCASVAASPPPPTTTTTATAAMMPHHVLRLAATATMRAHAFALVYYAKLITKAIYIPSSTYKSIRRYPFWVHIHTHEHTNTRTHTFAFVHRGMELTCECMRNRRERVRVPSISLIHFWGVRFGGYMTSDWNVCFVGARPGINPWAMELS